MSIVASETTIVLVDCDFRIKKVCCLKRLGLDPEDLDGILVTHEHSDHGVALRHLPISIRSQSTHLVEPGLKSELIDLITYLYQRLTNYR